MQNRTTYAQPIRQSVRAMELPEDYVDQAEQIISEMIQQGTKITSTKLRNLFAMFGDVTYEEQRSTSQEMSERSFLLLRMVRIRIAYECGRDASVNSFVRKTKLLEYLKGIGRDRKRLLSYIQYLEALVAYHRYFGGKQ